MAEVTRGTKVKICGNTNAEDAKLAIDLGADYIGLIFAPSKRQVDLEAGRAIRKSITDFDHFVGVFLNQDKGIVSEIATELNLKYLQFHGDETSRYCEHFTDKGFNVIKTFHIKDQMSLKRLDEYNVHAFLFDTYTSSRAGGTGLTFDWTLLKDKPYVAEKLFLAGGLTPENLELALRATNPYAVDVSSGVESEPGKKDPNKLRDFISIAKGTILK